MEGEIRWRREVGRRALAALDLNATRQSARTDTEVVRTVRQAGEYSCGGESTGNMGSDVQTRVVRIGERPHPAIRGYEGRERRSGVKVWVDDSVTGEGKVVAWLVKRGQEVEERGEEEVRGELNNNDVEGWAVKRGVEKALERVEEGEGVVVTTDSEIVAAQAIKYNTNWWMANEVQKVMERGVEELSAVLRTISIQTLVS